MSYRHFCELQNTSEETLMGVLLLVAQLPPDECQRINRAVSMGENFESE